MAGEINVKFKKGSLANVVSDAPVTQEAGQLLFAKYADEFEDGVIQGSLFFDFDDNTRIKMANDVDRARTLYAGVTLSNAVAGQFNANITGINSLYDGLTIALKINGNNSNAFNILNVNGLGDKLIWYKHNQIAKDEIKPNSEVILTYRSDLGAAILPSSGGPPSATLVPGNAYNDGWVMSNAPSKMSALTMTSGNTTTTYNGSENVNVKLGTAITLKTWEASSS